MFRHDLHRVIAVALGPWIRLHVALVSPATCRLGAGPPHDGPAVGRSRVRPHTRFRLGTFWEIDLHRHKAGSSSSVLGASALATLATLVRVPLLACAL